jgi:hypothetical protein
MPSLLGKRKSRTAESEPEATADAQEILRRHFEAHFKPLDIAARAAPTKRANDPHSDSDSDATHDSADGNQDDDDSEADAGQSDNEWGGLSDDEGRLILRPGYRIVCLVATQELRSDRQHNPYCRGD